MVFRGLALPEAMASGEAVATGELARVVEFLEAFTLA